MSLSDAVQGARHTPQTITWEGQNLTGASLTATKRNVDTGAVTSVDGAFAITDAANGVFTWTYGAGDVGAPGHYGVQIRATYALFDATIELSWVVHALQSATTVPASPLVGVSPDEAAYLTVARATVPDATDLIPDAPSDGTQYARKDAAWAAVAAIDTPALSAVWVAKHGNNANSGLSDTLPKLTIGAAITVASALITAGATAVRVEVLDGGEYTESITVPANIHIHARGATLRGTVALSAGAEVYLDRHYATANNQNLVSLDAAADGPAIYTVNVLDARPYTGVQNVRNIGGGGKNLFTRIGICYVGTSGVGYGDTSSGFGHIHIENEDLYLGGEGAVGIVATATGANTANIVGVIHHIIPIIPAPATTTAISISNANAVVKLLVAEITATVAYVITAGSLYLNCGKITGTQTGAALFLPANQIDFVAHTGAAGTAVHGLGTMATETATNYHATSAFSAAPTAAEPLKADGSGGILFGGVVTVDQPSTTGATPVLYLDQADVSEEIIEIVSTAGVGNAVEAVGAKTLTVTEFIKITINGNTRYIAAGTIA